MMFSEITAALRWWLVLSLLGAIAFPAVFVIFKQLPDRGYAFAKTAGLLLVSYLFWITGSLGFLGNNTGGILAAVAIIALFSYWLYRQEKQARAQTSGSVAPEETPAPSLSRWLSDNRSQVLLTELVFAALFFLWVWVRSQNPAISATEKPMEFAFLNAIGRSPTFPPLDPWLSGFAISYYYFGYIMTSLVARLAMVAEPIAFNLAIAWLVAGTGAGAFGLVYNMLRSQGADSSARLLGLVAALALPLAGNLTIGLEVAHANAVGSPDFWQWLDVRDLNTAPSAETEGRYEGSGWWWWRSSRPIHEYHLSGRAEDGLEPIAEFPAFSFVLGDLHPHVLALPFAFLSLALALAWWLTIGRTPGKTDDAPESWHSSSWWHRIQDLLHLIGYPLWIFTVLVLGGLAFLNTWDVLIHLFVILGAFALARWRAESQHSQVITQTLVVSGLLLIPAILLYLPFFLGFRSQAGAPYLLPMLMRPTRLVQFLIIFGMPLWTILVFLVALVARQRFRYWGTGLLVAAGLIAALAVAVFFISFIVASSPEGAGRMMSLAEELGVSLRDRPQQAVAFDWAFSGIAALLPTYLAARISYPALTILLAAIAGMVVMIWRERLGDYETRDKDSADMGDVLPMALLLIATGALLTLGPEFVFLRDNFGARLNTIFKFYYQAWVLFGVSALYAIGYLWLAWQGSRRTAPVLATAGYALLFLIALLFPIYAVNSRAVEYRGPITAEERRPATLDGLAQLNRFSPGDYAAVLWLRENVPGAPVILEAVGGQYSNYGRVSAATGLPTLLGWAGHEYQWRGSTPEPGKREPIVRDIYTTPDLQSVSGLLDEYDVRYIIVSDLERSTYGLSGMEKFDENLSIVFEGNGATIYRWQPQQ